MFPKDTQTSVKKNAEIFQMSKLLIYKRVQRLRSTPIENKVGY